MWTVPIFLETYPSGRTLSTGYDGANRAVWLQGLSDGSATNYIGNPNSSSTWAQYWPHGAVYYFIRGNSVWHAASYNNRLQPTESYEAVNNNSGQMLFVSCPNWGVNNNQNVYSLCPTASQTNDNGNLQSYAELQGGPGYSQFLQFNQSFTYDGANRLASITDGSNTRTFNYDSYGNMAVTANNGFSQNGVTPSSTSQFNSLNRLSTTGYDAAGNQLGLPSYCSNCLSYDAENRQTAYSYGANTTNYLYDAVGQRVEKTASGNAATLFVYDAFGQLAAEYATTVQTGLPCTTCYLSFDHLGSLRLMTDQNANVVARHDYLPFGEEIFSGSAGRNSDFDKNDSSNNKFSGQYRDPESGLDFFNARYFGAPLGRFLSPDPGNAGADAYHPQSWNAYAYVRNNPLAMVDPTGKDGCNVFNGTYEGSGSNFPCLLNSDPGAPPSQYDASQHYPSPAESPTSIAGGPGVAVGSMIGYQSPELAEGEAAYLSNVRSVIGWVAGDDPVTAMAFAPNDPVSPSACQSKILNAANNQFGTNYTDANVLKSSFNYSTGAPPGQGTLNLNISGSTAGVSTGYYPVNWWTYVIGYGPTLHVVSGPGGHGGLDSQQTLKFGPNQATFHIDSGYPYNPIGAFSHWLLNMTNAGGYPGC